jgi:hypothetical protein
VAGVVVAVAFFFTPYFRNIPPSVPEPIPPPTRGTDGEETPELNTQVPGPTETEYLSATPVLPTATPEPTSTALSTATETATLVPSAAATATETSVPPAPSSTPVPITARITVEDVSQQEGLIVGRFLDFTVTLDNAAVPGGFSVDVTLTDVTATGGARPLIQPEDYDNVVATLTFSGTVGETEQFSVLINGDVLVEGTETFTVNLEADNPLVDDSDTATGTILDAN